MELPPKIKGRERDNTEIEAFRKDKINELSALYRDVKGQVSTLQELIDLFGGLPINITTDDIKDSGKW